MAIHIDSIDKSFGEQVVLHNFCAEISEPGVTCIMGRSGSGKTTLLHILLGELKPDGGRILGTGGRRIAAVFQEDRLLPWCSALENVALVIDERTVSERPDIIAEAALIRLGIEADFHKPITEFSGGMQRRVALARAMVIEPEILFLDEPFKGLDEELKQRVMEQIKEYSKTKTVILVTHDIAEAEFFAARVIHLN